jgi:hypothetical protein
MPAADPLGPAPLVRFAQAGESPVLPGDDPSATAALGLLTAAIPLASPNPLPLNRLSIPDPFEQILVIRLSSPPADDDGPAITQDRPAWAPFPPAEPAK